MDIPRFLAAMKQSRHIPKSACPAPDVWARLFLEAAAMCIRDRQRPSRAFARLARVRGVAAQLSASPWEMRATQKRTCLPERTSDSVLETRRQRHCARGAAADGML